MGLTRSKFIAELDRLLAQLPREIGEDEVYFAIEDCMERVRFPKRRPTIEEMEVLGTEMRDARKIGRGR